MAASEFEEAAEVARDAIQEHAHGHPHETPEWMLRVGLTTMVMALFSAVGALLAGMTANDALLSRTAEIVEVVNRDREQLQIEIARSNQAVLDALAQDRIDDARLPVEARDIKHLTRDVNKNESMMRADMHAHELFAIGVTLLSIAITLSGMAVIANHPRIWHVGVVVGVVGAVFVGRGMYTMLSA